jgi:hypothetical protein
MSTLGELQIKQIQEQAAPDFGSLNSGNLSAEPAIDYNTFQEQPAPDISKLEVPDLQMTESETQAQGFNEQMRALNTQLLGESQARAGLETERGLPGMFQTQTDLANQIKTLQNEAQAIPLQIQQESEGQGRTRGGVAPLQAGRLRENAIKALSTSALLQATNNNILTAQTLVDRAVAQKYDPIRERINVAKANLELILNSPKYSLEDKNRAEKQKRLQEKLEKETATKEAEEKAIMGVALQAAQAGLDASTLDKIRNAESELEATQIAQEAGLYASSGEGFTLSPGQVRFDAQGNPIAQADDSFTLSPGQVRFNADGTPMAMAPEAPSDPKDFIQTFGDSLLQYNENTGQWEVLFTKPQDGSSLSIAEQLKLAESGYELSQGGELVKTSATPQEKLDKSNKVLNAVNNLLNSDWEGIVGAFGGRKIDYFLGEESYTALSLFDNLKSLLTLDNLGLMTGVLTDKDIEILTQAATPINRRMSKEAFASELMKIKNAATSIKNSNRLVFGEILDNQDGTYSYKNLDGTVHTGLWNDEYVDETVPKLDLNFNQVGGDTNQALPKKAAQAEPGERGGQCGRFVNQSTGLGLGDSYQSKMAKMDPSITWPEPGMVFVMPYGNTGHTGFILGVEGDQAIVKDSNYSLDEKVKIHRIPLSKITGLRRV